MPRQIFINAVVGGIIGYASGILCETEHPALGAIVFLAWNVGLINSLLPTQEK